MAYKGRNPRGKAPRKGFDKEEIKEKKIRGKEKANDPAWYIRENQLAKDVASFSFNNALGARCILNGDNAFGNVIFGAASEDIPGIMVLNSGPAVNPGDDESSAINLAAKNLYSFVRHQNSGHSNYESSDMMMYIMAMDSAYAYSAWMTRLYGMARLYSQVNRFVGVSLIRSCGVDPDDLIQNLADFRAYINLYNTKLSAFCTPAEMSIFRRHWWMYSGIFQDEDVAKAQFYIYNPAYLWQWNETSGNPVQLDATPIACTFSATSGFLTKASSPLKFTTGGVNIRTIGEGIIGALVGSEDVNIMSGDILKAYGRDKVWTMGMVSEDYVAVPIFSEEILDQIHNTIFVGKVPVICSDMSTAPSVTLDALALMQKQSPALVDYITYTPQFREARNVSIEHFLDMADNEPSPERVLVATRNMVHGYSEWNSNVNKAITTLDSAGSDICLYATMWYVDSTGALMSSDAWTSDLVGATIWYYTKFRRAPLIYMFTAANNHNIPQVIGGLGNFTVVDASDITKIHESAMLSMLGVPV